MHRILSFFAPDAVFLPLFPSSSSLPSRPFPSDRGGSRLTVRLARDDAAALGSSPPASAAPACVVALCIRKTTPPPEETSRELELHADEDAFALEPLQAFLVRLPVAGEDENAPTPDVTFDHPALSDPAAAGLRADERVAVALIRWDETAGRAGVLFPRARRTRRLDAFPSSKRPNERDAQTAVVAEKNGGAGGGAPPSSTAPGPVPGAAASSRVRAARAFGGLVPDGARVGVWTAPAEALAPLLETRGKTAVSPSRRSGGDEPEPEKGADGAFENSASFAATFERRAMFSSSFSAAERAPPPAAATGGPEPEGSSERAKRPPALEFRAASDDPESERSRSVPEAFPKSPAFASPFPAADAAFASVRVAVTAERRTTFGAKNDGPARAMIGKEGSDAPSEAPAEGGPGEAAAAETSALGPVASSDRSSTPPPATNGSSAPALAGEDEKSAGRVTMHYLYHRGKMRKTEIMEGFMCPFCLRETRGFQRLTYHLASSHDRFGFVFFPDGDEESQGPKVRIWCLDEPGEDGAVAGGSEEDEHEDWRWFHSHGGRYNGARRARRVTPRDRDRDRGEEKEPPTRDEKEPSTARAANPASGDDRGAEPDPEARDDREKATPPDAADAAKEPASSPVPSSSEEGCVAPAHPAAAPSAPPPKATRASRAPKSFFYASTRKYPMSPACVAELVRSRSEARRRRAVARAAAAEAETKRQQKVRRQQAQFKRRARERRERAERFEATMQMQSRGVANATELLRQIAAQQQQREAAARAALTGALTAGAAAEGTAQALARLSAGLQVTGGLGALGGLGGLGGGLGGLGAFGGQLGALGALGASGSLGALGLGGQLGALGGASALGSVGSGLGELLLQQQQRRRLLAARDAAALAGAGGRAAGAAAPTLDDEAALVRAAVAAKAKAGTLPGVSGEEGGDDGAGLEFEASRALTLFAADAEEERRRIEREKKFLADDTRRKEKRRRDAKTKRRRDGADATDREPETVEACIAKVNASLASAHRDGSESDEFERSDSEATAKEKRRRVGAAPAPALLITKETNSKAADSAFLARERERAERAKGKAPMVEDEAPEDGAPPAAVSSAPPERKKPGPKPGWKRRKLEEEREAREAAARRAAEAEAEAKARRFDGVGPPGTFYHAKTGQRIEARGADEAPAPDSDDEDDLRQFAREDLRRLSEYEDVAPGEISFMHDWNVFVRRFRPIGDREIPKALEAYAHWRGARMAEDPKWRRMFTMHCINQVDFGIVAPEHVDEALKIADQHRSARDARGKGEEGEAEGEAVPGATDGA